MDFKTIAEELKVDFNSKMLNICTILDYCQVPKIAQNIFQIEAGDIFKNRVTQVFNREGINHVCFEEDLKHYIFFSTTSEKLSEHDQARSLVNYSYEDIKQGAFNTLRPMLIKHFTNFPYLSPENKYFIINVLQEHSF